MDTPKSPTPCDNVITIPQFTGTCWFNTLLMNMFYSDGMRNFFMNHIKTITTKEKQHVVNVISDILHKQYYGNRKNFKRFYNELSPENLLELLHKEDGKLFYFDKNIESGHNVLLYFTRFVKYLEMENKVLYLHSKDTPGGLKGLFYSSYNLPTKIIRMDGEYACVPNVDGTDYKNVLIKSQWDKLMKKHITMLREFSIQLKEEPKNVDILVVSTPQPLTFVSNKFDEYDMFRDGKVSDEVVGDKIIYNNEVYVLNSLSLDNYDVKECGSGHSIAGVTCMGDRYMYNGWLGSTKDPAKSKDVGGIDTPCKLMKYDWFNNSGDFCLNARRCKLDKAILGKSELCFNVKKGDRTYIYVKDNTFHVDKKGKIHSKPAKEPLMYSPSPSSPPKYSTQFRKLSKEDDLCVENNTGIVHICKKMSKSPSPGPSSSKKSPSPGPSSSKKSPSPGPSSSKKSPSPGPSSSKKSSSPGPSSSKKSPSPRMQKMSPSKMITEAYCNKHYTIKELKDVARKLKKDGHKKILITVPKSELCKSLQEYLPAKQ